MLVWPVCQRSMLAAPMRTAMPAITAATTLIAMPYSARSCPASSRHSRVTARMMPLPIMIAASLSPDPSRRPRRTKTRKGQPPLPGVLLRTARLVAGGRADLGLRVLPEREHVVRDRHGDEAEAARDHRERDTVLGQVLPGLVPNQLLHDAQHGNCLLRLLSSPARCGLQGRDLDVVDVSKRHACGGTAVRGRSARPASPCGSVRGVKMSSSGTHWNARFLTELRDGLRRSTRCARVPARRSGETGRRGRATRGGRRVATMAGPMASDN